jgi:hypothetical protein
VPADEVAQAAAEAERAAEAEALAADEAARAAAARAEALDVVPWLQKLGYSAKHARAASELCAHIPDAPLEERVRVALRYWRQ